MADKPERPAQKFFDVSHPGKSTPSSTSRPTIVGHHTILQDPMVNADHENEEAITNTSSIVSRISTTNIVPSDEAVAGYNSTEKIADTSEPSVEEVKDKVEDEPQIDEPKAEETELIEPESKEPAEETSDIQMQSTDGTNTEEQKKVEKETKEDIEKQEAITKLIADKTYFAPIAGNKGNSAKRNFVMPIIAALVVVFVAGYLLIDSGIIKTSVKLPVSFFNK
ncbi:MAG: hypothetical protein NTX80_03480 [Candidatus Saccharibacteria bacterium]|nr:hypothetical protein [Candidatus Saccharibacteria bacterium]